VLSQALSAFSHADLASVVVAEETQAVCDAWQLLKQLTPEAS
jgi:hypothetical protein